MDAVALDEGEYELRQCNSGNIMKCSRRIIVRQDKTYKPTDDCNCNRCNERAYEPIYG